MFRIKYDTRDKKAYAIIAMIASILTVLDIGCLSYEHLSEQFSATTGAILLCAVYPLGILAIASFMLYLDAVLYLKRLKQYGYEEPYDKKMFHKNLEELPRTKSWEDKNGKSCKNHDSMLLAGMAAIIVICLFIYDIWFWYHYFIAGGNFIILGLLLFLPTVIWLILGIFYARQMSDRKYKDDVEIDRMRKNRQTLMGGLITVLLLFVITLIYMDMIKSMMQYMINR